MSGENRDDRLEEETPKTDRFGQRETLNDKGKSRRKFLFKGTLAVLGAAGAGAVSRPRYVRPVITTLTGVSDARAAERGAGENGVKARVTDEQLERLGVTREEFESMTQEDMDTLQGCWCSCQAACTTGHCENTCTNGNQR